MDVTLAYGMGYRMEDRDARLVGAANGGKAASVNGDSGNLNYDKGIISNALRLNTDLTLTWNQFGVYARGYAFYDYENAHEDREREPFSSQADEILGKDADLLDHYISLRTDAWNVPLLFRLGDQVVNWGESGFVRDGVDIINPLNLAALNQPVVSTRDVLIPQGMLWGAANISETFALEAYYQYEWKSVVLPPVSSYFSTNDLLGGDGVNFAVLGAGRYSDLGTDLDATFALPAGTLGFDSAFYKLPGLHSEKPQDEGQFGVTLSAILPDSNATKVAAHFVRYHSRLPLISGRTASQQAVDQTSQASVDALAASLVPSYEATGLSPEEAADTAANTAAALTTSHYANQAGYIVEYPEDITMVGLSFATATLKRGMLFSGEISHHRNFPFQVNLSEVFAAVLSPVQFRNGGSALGSYGADEEVKGYVRLDRTQATLGLNQLLGAQLGAAQTFASADIAGVYVHDMPRRNELPLQGVDTPTAGSWGYRLAAGLTYEGVFGGLSVEPRVLYTNDAHGITPAPVSTFVEDRQSLTLALGFGYINRIAANLSYTSFFGAGARNQLNDRDIARFRISYTF